uniref:Reverse transcriptase domain-containing protein n=1 Tax=Syphacia muris TaxID=451379 RepID=A0A0N5B1D9_9BILA
MIMANEDEKGRVPPSDTKQFQSSIKTATGETEKLLQPGTSSTPPPKVYNYFLS